MPRELDEVRGRVRAARHELAAAEDVLADSLTAEVLVLLDSLGASMKATRDLVREVPERASLDYNSARRETIGALEEMERNVRALAAKVAKLRRSEP